MCHRSHTKQDIWPEIKITECPKTWWQIVNQVRQKKKPTLKSIIVEAWLFPINLSGTCIVDMKNGKLKLDILRTLYFTLLTLFYTEFWFTERVILFLFSLSVIDRHLTVISLDVKCRCGRGWSMPGYKQPVHSDLGEIEVINRETRSQAERYTPQLCAPRMMSRIGSCEKKTYQQHVDEAIVRGSCPVWLLNIGEGWFACRSSTEYLLESVRRNYTN